MASPSTSDIPCRLRPGIKILEPIPPGILQGPRVSLSNGTKRVRKTGDGKDDLFRPDSVVPQQPWRRPTAVETNLLLSDSSVVRPGEWIQVVRFPDHLLSPFRELQRSIAAADAFETVLSISQSVTCLAGITSITAYLASWTGDQGQSLAGAGILLNRPGGCTTTTDARGKLIGLHVDTWYSPRIEDRQNSPGRIVINIGCSERSFLFVNLPLRAMATELSALGDQALGEGNIGTGLPRTFLDICSDYPAVRLRVAPGEAYLAPTENISHDGSTLEAKHIDAALTVRGHFSPQLSIAEKT